MNRPLSSRKPKYYISRVTFNSKGTTWGTKKGSPLGVQRNFVESRRKAAWATFVLRTRWNFDAHGDSGARDTQTRRKACPFSRLCYYARPRLLITGALMLDGSERESSRLMIPRSRGRRLSGWHEGVEAEDTW